MAVVRKLVSVGYFRFHIHDKNCMFELNIKQLNEYLCSIYNITIERSVDDIIGEINVFNENIKIHMTLKKTEEQHNIIEELAAIYEIVNNIKYESIPSNVIITGSYGMNQFDIINYLGFVKAIIQERMHSISHI